MHAERLDEPIATEHHAGASHAAREWSRRVEAEYRSAALTAHLCHWLVQIGASPDLVREGLRVADDELAHAEASRAVVLAARTCVAQAPAASAPRLSRESLAYERRWEPLELDVAAACVETFCLGETVAVPLFRMLREAARVPIAIVALDRILKDEVRHRDFGWLLLESLLRGPEGALCRAFVEHQLPAMIDRLAQSYGALADEREVAAGVRAWGLMPGADYAAALALANTRDYRPRLMALGLDASGLARLDGFGITASA